MNTALNNIEALGIVYYGHPVLRKKGEKVTQFDETLSLFAQRMLKLMIEANGLGLAAQQVGVNLQFFVVDMSYIASKDSKATCLYDGNAVPLSLVSPLYICNLEFLEKSKEVISYEEGCLSFSNDIRSAPDRAEKIKVRFQDLTGAWHTLECEDVFSVCMQHEYDHTQGRLIIDYLDPAELKAIKPKLKKLKKKYSDSLRNA